jgi:hypothetical protein
MSSANRAYRRRLGRNGLLAVARIAKPDTILAWYRQLVAEKYDGFEFIMPAAIPSTATTAARYSFCRRSSWFTNPVT